MTVAIVVVLLSPQTNPSAAEIQRHLQTVRTGEGPAPSPPGHPPSITVQIPAELAPDFEGPIIFFAGACIVLFALLAAAASRRLHDRDRSALWSLLPLPFIVLGFVFVASALLSDVTITEAFVVVQLLNGGACLASMIFLTIQLASPGTPGRNRFG